MKKFLLFSIVFATVIFLFFVCEIFMIKNGSLLPSVIRYIFGALFVFFFLIFAVYLIGSKIFEYNIPYLITSNIIEIVALAIVVLVSGIVLLA